MQFHKWNGQTILLSVNKRCLVSSLLLKHETHEKTFYFLSIFYFFTRPLSLLRIVLRCCVVLMTKLLDLKRLCRELFMSLAVLAWMYIVTQSLFSLYLDVTSWYAPCDERIWRTLIVISCLNRFWRWHEMLCGAAAATLARPDEVIVIAVSRYIHSDGGRRRTKKELMNTSHSSSHYHHLTCS